MLEDWIENNHLAKNVTEKTIRTFNKICQRSYPELSRCPPTLSELTAFALYQTLLQDLTPRSIGIISAMTGVMVKKLKKLYSMLNNAIDTNAVRPSIWMPGLSVYLPITYKEHRNICGVADAVQ